MLRNPLIDRWIGRESEIPAHRDELAAEIEAGSARTDLATAGISAGVAAGLISSARPAGDIVRDIVREAETVLRDRRRALMDR